MNHTYTPESPQLLAAWHHRMKSAMAKANEIDDEVKDQRRALREFCKRAGYSRNRMMAYMGSDLELSTLLDDFKFYSGEVQRFNAMIQAELAMHILLKGD